jgi:translation initiation factor 2 alpha subunit (eIF-2alpha)
MVYLYPKNKPDINEVVIVKITDINELNVVASLIDYNNIVGYISFSELSKKKRYKLHKIVHIGKEVIVQIIGFNDSKNYAELSIRTLIESDTTQFTNLHQTYLKSYNLWRYVYMKLNPELNMDISQIESNEINNFMEKTLWKIGKSIEKSMGDPEDPETLETSEYKLLESEFGDSCIDIFNDVTSSEKIYNIFLNPSKNIQYLKYITDYDISQLKTILDAQSQLKINPVKQTKYTEFTAYSYEMNGLANLKKSFDYKSFEKYSELSDKYDITVLYLTGNKYSLTLKQKFPMNDDITEKYDYLVQEIKTRCEVNNVVLSM